ncbi:tail fiber domain-containing protein [Psychroserpens sp.]
MKPLQYFIAIMCFLVISNSYSQVGIGTTSPDDSTVLDIMSADKGLLIPRLSLISVTTTMLDGINTAATSLLIYNTNTAVIGGNGVGYYFFNGSFWEKLITSTSYIEKIDDLLDGKSDSDGSQDGSSIFLGVNSGLNDDSSDNKNVGIGFETMLINTSGYNNSTIGYQSLYSNTTGSGNTANGFHALTFNTVGNWNVANGYRSLFNNIGGNNNTANGYQSLFYNTNGYNNTVNGYEAMFLNLTGNDNTASGLQSLYSNSSGSNNTAFGVRAMYLNIDGIDNAATGDRSLYSNTSGRFNTANGSNSMAANTSGDFNTAMGYQSLLTNTQGINNVANGSRSLYSNTYGNDNTANGFRALYYNIDGDYNTASGSFSLFFNNTGNQNIGIGHESLFTNTTGSYNIGIGSRTGSGNSNGSSNIYLGHSAGTPETGSNKLYIENSGANADNALIYGEFDTNILRTNSQFQIGNPTGTGYAFPLVDGTANQILQSDGSGAVSWVDSSTLSSDDHDWYEEGSTNAPNDISDDIFTQGNVAIGKNTADYALDIGEDSETRALNVSMTNTSNADNYSAYFENLSTGTGEHYGLKTSVSGSDKIYGNYNDLSSNGNGFEMFGIYNSFKGTFTTSGTKYGLYNNFENHPATSTIGVQNEMIHRESNLKYGVINNVTSNGQAIGVTNNISGGIQAIGTTNLVSGGLNASSVIGTKNVIGGNSVYTGYASYNVVSPTYLGAQIGVYSEVTASGVHTYAGYFRGRLAVGTTVFNSSVVDSYVFPASRGTANQIMQTDATGNVSWVDINTAISHNIDDLIDGKSDNDGTQNGSSLFLGVGSGNNDDSSDNRNLGIGYQSLNHVVSGINNIALGYNSLYWNTSGNDNTALGVNAGHNNGGNSNVFLGFNSGFWEFGNSKLYIENSIADADNALIYGEFDNNILRVNGELQLGNSAANRYVMPQTDGIINQIMQTDGSGQLSWVDSTTVGTDNQNLTGATLTGNTLQLDIENGTSTSVDLSALNTGGDITTVTAGDGLTGGGTNGAITLDVVATNGLTTNANDIVLGGNLSQDTTITQGTNDLAFNLSNSGDFLVQDNGVDVLEVRDNGIIYFGTDTFWKDIDTGGTNIGALIDDGDDGRFLIYENGVLSVDLDANTGFIFNEQGLDRDFRIESDDETSMFRVDANNNRIGVMEATPSFDIHLKQSTRTQAGTGGIGFESSDSANNWKLYHSGTNFSFSENGTRRGYIEAGTGNYIPTSDRRLKKSITAVESILDKVHQIKTYRYLYKDQELSAKKSLGFMAQDILSLFPELVGQAEDGYFGLNYAGFGVVAIKAIQEQQDLIDLQQQQIEALQNSEAETTQLLQRLLKRIENLENQD